MTVKTAVATEELEPGDWVAHVDVPEHVLTGCIARREDDGALVVWPGMYSTTVPLDRLRLVERPEACVVVEFSGDELFDDMTTVEPYTFVNTGTVASVREDIDIYQTARGYDVVSFRLGSEDRT